MKARFNMAQDAGSSGFVPEIDDDDATPFGRRTSRLEGRMMMSSTLSKEALRLQPWHSRL